MATERGYCTSCEDWFEGKYDLFFIQHRGVCRHCYFKNKENEERKKREYEQMLANEKREKEKQKKPAPFKSNLMGRGGVRTPSLAYEKGLCRHCKAIIESTRTICKKCISERARARYLSDIAEVGTALPARGR